MSVALLSTLPIGSVVTLKENGVPTPFLVLKHGYPTLGNGRTLLYRKNAVYIPASWRTGPYNNFEGSNLDNYLNNNYLQMIEEPIRNHIAPVDVKFITFTYDGKEGYYGTITVPKSVFLLSTTELGTGSGSWGQGTNLDYFDSAEKRKCECDPYDFTGNIVSTNAKQFYSTRSAHTNHNQLRWVVDTSDGTYTTANAANTYSSRPAFTVDSDLYVLADNSLSANAPPTTPSFISHGTPKAGKSLLLTCGESVDPEEETVEYVWERRIDSGVYIQIGITTVPNLTDTVPEEGTYYQVRVKAVDASGGESDYVTGTSIEIVYNQDPTISGEDTAIGDSINPMSYNYTVDDADENQTLTVTESVSNSSGTITIRSFTATRQEEYTADLASVWLRLLPGAHTLTITVTDSAGGIAQRKLTFNKICTRLAASRTFTTDEVVNKCFISFFPQVRPEDSDFYCEVSNNPFDEEPVWEEVTAKVNKTVHLFTNQTVETTPGLAYRFYYVKGTTPIEVSQVTIRFN